MAVHDPQRMTPTAANRLGLDYRAEAARLGPPVVPIIDSHLHINGREAAGVYAEVCGHFGIDGCISQTQLAHAPAVREVLGDRVRFVAIPEYMSTDRRHAFTEGFVKNLDIWHGEYGARMVKLWGAPRMREFLKKDGIDPDMAAFDSPWRMRVAERAVELGMMLMVHVADPDTWFKTMYTDASFYGTKAQQYESLERLLRAFDVPCLCAHMAGWPEDLAFLTRFLDEHPKVVLDTSATKWIVRELSKHPSDELIAFLMRFEGRILFGSDIVTHDDHLREGSEGGFGADLASTREGAFDLYASRYWTLRTMFETGYRGESPIADPDLMMVEPDAYDAMSAPALTGHAVPKDLLKTLYRGAAERTVLSWYESGRFRTD